MTSSLKRIVAVLLVFAMGIGIWYFAIRDNETIPTKLADSTEPAPDPRLAFQTIFRNVKPDVKYVGDARCASCHGTIDQTYHQHPMGRSAFLGGKAESLEKLDAKHHNPLRTESHTLSVAEREGRVFHRMTANDSKASNIPAYEIPIDLAIGSGTRGRSYLTLDRGALWQSPISWFTDDDRWNVSPGFQIGDGGRRPITPECLFCHVDQTVPVPHAKNRYEKILLGQAHIGCERCHGPGELHVAERTANANAIALDTSIVNPKHLTPDLQMDICRQCHLLGEQRVTHFGRDLWDYRPGLPLSQFLNVFVRHPDWADQQRSVGQFEQMERSVCFTKSGGKMTCTSCHDPHERPEAKLKDVTFRNRCLTCHTDRGCNQPLTVRNTKNDSCIACHMPRRDSTSIAHAAVTDHHIPRNAAATPVIGKPANIRPGMLPLIAYPSGPHGPSEDAIERNLGVALSSKLLTLGTNRASIQSVASLAARYLDGATSRKPADAVAWQGLSSAFAMLGERDRRLQSIRKAAELTPDSEEVLLALAETEIFMGHVSEALAAVEKLICLNPSAIEYRLTRASIYYIARDWSAAEASCREAIAINPMNAESHILRAMNLDALGKRDEAQKEADIAFALERNPEVQKQYRSWFRPK
jgi:predicted CXXCH cytochrome family protein